MRSLYKAHGLLLCYIIGVLYAYKIKTENYQYFNWVQCPSQSNLILPNSFGINDTDFFSEKLVNRLKVWLSIAVTSTGK